MPKKRQQYSVLNSDNLTAPARSGLPVVPPLVQPWVTGRGRSDVYDKDKALGLSTIEAYTRLFQVADVGLKKWQQDKPDFFVWWVPREECDVVTKGVLYQWPSDRLTPIANVMVLIATAMLIGLCNIHSHYRSTELATEAVVLTFFAIVLMLIILHERKLRHIELSSRLEAIMKKFRMMERHGVTANHYSDLKEMFPSSSCDRVPTWRDGALVGVPAVLLVAGDRIVLKPGDRSPAFVHRVVEKRRSKQGSFDNSFLDLGELEPGEAFTSQDSFSSNVPQHKRSVSVGVDFEVSQGILEQNLEAMNKASRSRRRTALNNERILCTILIQRFAIVLYALAFLANAIRFVFFKNDVGHWVELFVLLPINCILPFFPLSFPVLWIGANLHATAQLFALLPSTYKTVQDEDNLDTVSIDSWDSESSEEMDDETRTSRTLVLRYFFKGLQGDSGILTRATNMVHVLGNFSVLSCVDKRGILSQPIPAPETAFVFSNQPDLSTSPTNESDEKEFDDHWSEQEESDADSDAPTEPDSDNRPVTLEIFNQAGHRPNGLWFASASWTNHIDSLKPLGLAMLLNSGCRSNLLGRGISEYRSSAECDAGRVPDNVLISCARSCTGPRCCLCRLAMEIGFSKISINSFRQLQLVLTVSKGLSAVSESRSPLHITSDTSTIEESHVSKSNEWNTQRFVPYMSSIVVEDIEQGSMQLFTCGTADMVLQYCDDFWNGTEIVPLAESQRRSIVDYSAKTSSSMSCYAFSYRPIYSNMTNRVYRSESTTPLPPHDRSPSRVVSSNDLLSQDIKVANLLEMKQDNCNDNSHEASRDCSREMSDGSLTSTNLNGKTFLSECQFHSFDVENDKIQRSSAAERVQDIVEKQIFIGMVGVQDQPISDVTSLIEDLDDSGIRFVYFSGENGADSKAFASKLGLEIGWNCHISLSTTVDSDYDAAEQNARLPRGIDEIRPHIRNVDDVPLLVPLFSGCTPTATASMIEIMQEEGRVVCCIGSSMNSFNINAFAQADMSIAFDPVRAYNCFEFETDRRPFVAHRGATSAPLRQQFRRAETTAAIIAAHFNTIPCSFCLPRDVDFKLEILIRESRRLSLNLRQCFAFLFYGQGTLALVNVVSQMAFLPPIMNGLQVLWISVVPLPIIAASLLATSAEPGLMDLRTSDLSRKEGLKGRIRQYIGYFVARAAPTLLTEIILFGIILHGACEHRHIGSCHILFGYRDYGKSTSNETIPMQPSSWNGRGAGEVTDLVLAQSICCWFFVLNLCVTSTSMIHRSLPFHKCVNRPWLGAIVAAILLQTGFFAATVAGYNYSAAGVYRLSDLPLAAPLIAIGGTLILFAIIIKVRLHFRAIDIRDQKRMVLAFGTKLGMHSPQ